MVFSKGNIPWNKNTKGLQVAWNKGKQFLCGKDNPFYGKTHTPESIEKMRRSQIGKKASEETKKKLSLKKKGVLFTDNHHLNLAERNCGGFWYGNVRYYNEPQYCEKWTKELRERVRAFFNYQCVECGTPQNGRKLTIHHVWYNRKLCCDDSPRSLVALCNHCHGRTQHNREHWSNHFQEIIDNKYNGKCWFTKDEYTSFKCH